MSVCGGSKKMLIWRLSLTTIQVTHVRQVSDACENERSVHGARQIQKKKCTKYWLALTTLSRERRVISTRNRNDSKVKGLRFLAKKFYQSRVSTLETASG